MVLICSGAILAFPQPEQQVVYTRQRIYRSQVGLISNLSAKEEPKQRRYKPWAETH